MTVRLSSDSKDKQQADTIRLFLEVAKEGGNNQEDKLEENEKLEEDVEVMTQKVSFHLRRYSLSIIT